MTASTPTRDELLDAVRTHLLEQLLPQLTGSARYQLRVAVKALEMVARENALGLCATVEEGERLGHLLRANPVQSLSTLNAELCARLRDGSMRYDDPALLAHLRASTLARLAIDNPRFGSYRAAIRSQTDRPDSNGD